jgi:hypothetical protein
MFQVADNYPGGTARGADYFTGAALGEINTIDPETGEDRVRRERVVITPAHIDFEGQVCIGERTVRHLAHLFGMVDGWRVERMRREHDSLLAAAQQLAAELEQSRTEAATLAAMVDRGRDEVFVAIDGTRWPKLRNAVEASRASMRLGPTGTDGLRSITADEAPIPEGVASR